MSQDKVNKYKEAKMVRKEEVKKKKRKHNLEMFAWALVGVVFVGWIGFSAYDLVTRDSSTNVVEYPIDSKALDDYVNTIATEGEETTADTTEVPQ